MRKGKGRDRRRRKRKEKKEGKEESHSKSNVISVLAFHLYTCIQLVLLISIEIEKLIRTKDN
jgi:hypothetical protein